MPEKQIRINNKPYLLNYGTGQDDQLDRLVSFINQRIEPYATRFSEYSESYLLLLTLLDLANELDQVTEAAPNQEVAQRLKNLAHHAEALVKQSEEQ